MTLHPPSPIATIDDTAGDAVAATQVTPVLPASRGQCPVHAAYSQRKSAAATTRSQPAIERTADGVWHVREFHLARTILRSTQTRQAGFKAEWLERMPSTMNKPVLYQEGAAHFEQRKQTARFFTPAATSANYRQLMEELADQMIAELQRQGEADLSALSMTLAVQVASKVVGLTDSHSRGIDQRLDVFFDSQMEPFNWTPSAVWNMLLNQWRVFNFYWQDVRPAIQERRQTPQADVISYLLEKGYRDSEILTECVTYAAAGMATTREFISMVAWHMLEQPELRARYVAGSEEERHTILHEILRLEPVVGRLQRRAESDIAIETSDGPITIPAGALIEIEVDTANVDPAITGEAPLAVCPNRELKAERAHRMLLSFGDGHHRCPGAYVAIQESDIFLHRLLALPTVRIEQEPDLTWSELTAGYELRNFIIAVD